ncbi:MAG: TniB family NTP-binding protein [Anaerolineales bacterium]|nr:TniB family NTP-binding protein [Anaerolineales bacterium]
MTKVLKLSLLGPLDVKIDDQPLHGLVSGKAQALLCYLAVNGRSHTRHALAGLLWGDLPEADARRNLRGVLMKLRQEVAPYLEIRHQSVAFNQASPHRIDVKLFQQQITSENMADVEAALALYRGEFLQAFVVREASDFEAWVSRLRTQTQQEAIAAFDRVIAACIEQGDYEKGLRYAQRLLHVDETRERSHRVIMRLLALSGERSRALEQFTQCEAVLMNELGVGVSAETAVLAEQIRAGAGDELSIPPRTALPPKPALKQTAKAQQTAVSPQFIAGPPIVQPIHFFGRHTILKRLFNLLRTRPLQNAAIIGPRRSGKTSLLHYLKNIAATPHFQLRPDQSNDWLPQPQQYQWVFVDFQDPRLGTVAGLLRHILSALRQPLPEQCTIDQFMDLMEDHLQQPTVILFDEIGVALERYAELDDAFWESMRSLATNQVGGLLSYVLTSHAPPDQLAQHSGLGSPFFNIFGYTAVLGPLSESEARDLIAYSPIPFVEEDVAWMLAESGRWPLLLQILCRERLLTLEEGESGNLWRAEALRQMQPFIKLKDGS